VDKVPNADSFVVSVGGQDRAEVHSVGFIHVHYRAQLSQGTIETDGDFAGSNYNLTRDGTFIGSVYKQGGAPTKDLVVDIVDGQEDVFVLAVVLAIARVRENPGRYSDNPF
jgi:uncharacterized protein YxjI